MFEDVSNLTSDLVDEKNILKKGLPENLTLTHT